MRIRNKILLLCDLLDINLNELANVCSVPYITLKRLVNDENLAEEKNLDKIYTFAYSKGIFFNEIYEQLYTELKQDETTRVLYHGSKQKLELPIDFLHSKENNDFGVGFYLGESFKQAASYISNSKSTAVYSFALNIKNLKFTQFKVDREWMFAIAYYRGWLHGKENNRLIKKIIEKVNVSDVVVAPIADNRMFDIISEFVRNEITDQQCEHSLSATNLGMQYVVKSKKAIKHLDFIGEMYVSNIEKEDLIESRNLNFKTNLNKVSAARIEFKNKGKYIDEILK